MPGKLKAGIGGCIMADKKPCHERACEWSNVAGYRDGVALSRFVCVLIKLCFIRGPGNLELPA